jgi:hypothetical protein
MKRGIIWSKELGGAGLYIPGLNPPNFSGFTR